MRKWLLALSVTGLVIVSAICALWLEDVRMEVPVIDTKKAQTIEEKLNQQSDAMKFDLMFAGEALAYDSAGKTFFLPLSMETEDWEEGGFEAGDGVQIWFTEDFTKESKLLLMREDRAIPFYAVSGDRCEMFYLKLTGLPVLDFTGTEQMTENGEPLFELVLYDTDHEGDWVKRCLTTSMLRGNTSLNYEKKSLRLKLKEQGEDGTYQKVNKNFLEIREDDDWILNSLYADNSRIRDKLAMDLWQETGAYGNPYGQNFGVKGEYVEVLINDGYVGLYLLTHPVDRKQLGMDSVSSQLAAGKDVIERIYKKKYTAAWQEEDFIGNLPDSQMPDYRGGFYLKGDTILQNEQEWDPLRRMAACIEAEDEEFSAQIGELGDISNILDNWLFYQAIAGFDNENKNVYYVVRQKDTGSCGYFVPWDMNISFGAIFEENEYYCAESMKGLEEIVEFEPGMRVVQLDVSGAQAQVQTKWRTWREGVFSTESLCARMDSLTEVLVSSGAMKRETERWPGGNASPDISFMKQFTTQRLEFLDGYVEALGQ
nr:CotH kinase family protein [Lachnospiraceae bacterium]